MKDYSELKETAKNEYTLFFKNGCQYSKAAKALLDTLVENKVIENYQWLVLGDDFDEKEVTDLCGEYGSKPKGYATKVTIPQIFMKGEYFNGSNSFYGSRWNLGDEDSGIIVIYDDAGEAKEYKSPNLPNPNHF